MRHRNARIVAAVVMLALAALIVWRSFFNAPQAELSSHNSGTTNATVLHEDDTQADELGAEEPGRQEIGGAFQLVDHNGLPRTDADFSQKFLVVYFGYTFCPDICPTGLRSLTHALEKLKPDEIKRIQPLFITVDPDRDTPGELKTFVGQYHPTLVGLTGTPSDIESVAKKYKVFFQMHREGTDGQHYLVDHSSIFYIINPQGVYCSHFTHASSVEEMLAALRHALNHCKPK
jgi:protein SCO1